MTRLAVLLILCAALLPAQPMSSGDRNYILSHFHATRKLFLDSIAGLGASQWSYKPAAGRWSIAEIAEHVVLSEDVLFAEFRKLLAKPAGAARKVEREEDEKILQWITNRGNKAEADAGLQPTGRWKTPEEMAREFKARRDRTIDYLIRTNDNLRGRLRGEEQKIDAYQWLLILSGHVERHVAQINEVKAAAGYPR